MQHPEIEERNLVEKYVLGRLSEDEEIAFENHFADCVECQEQIEAAQDLAEGLEQMRDEMLPATTSPSSWPRELSSPTTSQAPPPQKAPMAPGWWAVAATALLALLPSLWLAERKASLEERVATLSQPFEAAPAVVFEATRDAGTAVSTVTPRTDQPFTVLALVIEDLEDFQLAARLEDETGQILWQGENLRPSRSGHFQLAVPSDRLKPGEYFLQIELVDAQGRRQEVNAHRFKVQERAASP